MRKEWVLLLTMGLAGCATTPVSSDVAKSVPADRVFAFQTSAGPDAGTVEVIRDSGFLGKGCNAFVYIDGKEAASMATSEKVDFSVLPGQHIFSTGPTDKGLCGLNGKGALNRAITIEVKPNHVSIYRLAVLGDGGVTPMPVQL